MNDLVRVEPPYRVLTPDDLTRFHKAKDIETPRCWACGNVGWYLQSGGQIAGHRINYANVDGTTPEAGWLVFNMVCTKCATVWAMDFPTIIKWLDEHPNQMGLIPEGTPPP